MSNVKKKKQYIHFALNLKAKMTNDSTHPPFPNALIQSRRKRVMRMCHVDIG